MKRFNILSLAPPSAPTKPTAPTAPTPAPAENFNHRILPIGTRIYCGLYGGKDGILYHVRGEQSPHTCQSLGGVGVTGGEAHFDIVWTGERAGLSCVPEALVRDSVQWEILDEPIATADEIKTALAVAEEKRLADEAEQRRKTEARAKERAELPAKYPFLTTVAKGGRATANLKLELQRAFPGVKFSVTQSRGSSYIDCRWELGPTVEQVDAIAAKYEEGHFDGMSDSYEYNHDNVFPDVFGGGRGVSTSRRWPNEFNDRVARDLCTLQGVAYEGQFTRHLLGKSDERDSQQHVNILLARTAWPVGASYHGVQFNPDRVAWSDFSARMFALHGTGWASRDLRAKLAPEDLARLVAFEAQHNDKQHDDHWCRIVFDLPSTPSSIVHSPSSSVGPMSITATKHTKAGYPIWVVQLADRVDRDTFVKLRDECKACGGWYSSYRGGGAIPGFTFKEQANAEKFVAEHSAPSVPSVAPVLSDVYLCADCGAEFTDGEARDAHYLSPACVGRVSRDGATVEPQPTNIIPLPQPMKPRPINPMLARARRN